MLSKYNVITLFPNLFDEWIKTGIISNGLDKNILKFQTTNYEILVLVIISKQMMHPTEVDQVWL